MLGPNVCVPSLTPWPTPLLPPFSSPLPRCSRCCCPPSRPCPTTASTPPACTRCCSCSAPFATTPGTARDLCGQHLTSITTNLLALAAYPHAMEVRETAVECVTALAGLPHTQVFPHTKKVLRAMDARLDDPKRAVRRAAVMCKTTWCVA
ncbi:hypothetical protein CLOP_g11985 [Closterium sp. NIES-67]|nr:hypothetical protein CLOP_g11985 [Closterium sp. NIES-67]